MPDPAEVITVTLGGKTFRTCRFCAAHIEWTIQELATDHPGKTFRIIQPSWNTGVPASEGTHDKCACFDVEIIGLGIWVANRWLRRHGWRGWVRTPAQGFAWHIHTISAGCPAPKGRFVDGAGGTATSQLDDYNRHALGLKGLHNSGSDPECRDDPKHGFAVFNYGRWLEEHWFEMATKAELAEVVGNQLVPIAARVETLVERTEGLRVTLADLGTKLALVDAKTTDAATKDLVRKMRDQVIAALSEPEPV